MDGPYRDNAKEPELPKFWVCICHTRQKMEAHASGFVRAKDRWAALEKFRKKKKLEEHSIWSSEVVGLAEFDELDEDN